MAMGNKFSEPESPRTGNKALHKNKEGNETSAALYLQNIHCLRIDTHTCTEYTSVFRAGDVRNLLDTVV